MAVTGRRIKVSAIIAAKSKGGAAAGLLPGHESNSLPGAANGLSDEADSILDASDGVSDASVSVLEASDGASDASVSVLDASDGALDASVSVLDASDGALDASKTTTDASVALSYASSSAFKKQKMPTAYLAAVGAVAGVPVVIWPPSRRRLRPSVTTWSPSLMPFIITIWSRRRGPSCTLC